MAIAACPIATYWVGPQAIPLVMVLALAAGCATFISSSGIESNPMPNMAITMLGVFYAIYLIQSVLYTFLLTETLATPDCRASRLTAPWQRGRGHAGPQAVEPVAERG